MLSKDDATRGLASHDERQSASRHAQQVSEKCAKGVQRFCGLAQVIDKIMKFRATQLPSHGRGHRFNPCRTHHFGCANLSIGCAGMLRGWRAISTMGTLPAIVHVQWFFANVPRFYADEKPALFNRRQLAPAPHPLRIRSSVQIRTPQPTPLSP